ncbi:MAG: polymer-forming cytoskeletal protein [Proteobacteria bacterium]|nr:polymer-forming cytoskeletal protein [Pseudomonadota bacterium]
MFQRDSGSRIDTLLDRSVRIHGDVEFEGGMHLDGQIVGHVREVGQGNGSLTVSETGAIEGPVQVSNVDLHGTVRGDIVARGRVVLGPTARVAGDVHYGVIEMTLGAQITGSLVRLAAGPDDKAAPAP